MNHVQNDEVNAENWFSIFNSKTDNIWPRIRPFFFCKGTTVASWTEPIPGTTDILPPETAKWQLLERQAHDVFTKYGYGELRTPIFERTDVFMRSIGDDTDIVRKEMYTFTDRGGRSLTLRPEGTAGVLRALVNNGLPQGDERRVYYAGPMFRGERPAAGRKRQFHQIGTECVGKALPQLDVENISMLVHFLEYIGLEEYDLLLNSRGELTDRERISSTLHTFFLSTIDAMCNDCQERINTNVWRILDCKNESCRDIVSDAPSIIDLLGKSSRLFFQDVCNGLESLGVRYTIEPRLVRGLDYYAHTVFEIVCSGIGAQSAIAGGGRYEIHFPGQKKPIYGVGFAVGVERLQLAQEQQSIASNSISSIDFYLVSLGAQARRENLKLANKLRHAGCSVLMDFEDRGLKAQMRTANKTHARFTLIQGDNELQNEVITCKDMVTSKQFELSAKTIIKEVPNLLTGKTF